MNLKCFFNPLRIGAISTYCPNTRRPPLKRRRSTLSSSRHGMKIPSSIILIVSPFAAFSSLVQTIKDVFIHTNS